MGRAPPGWAVVCGQGLGFPKLFVEYMSTYETLVSQPMDNRRRLLPALLAEFIGMTIFQIYGGSAHDEVAAFANGITLAVVSMLQAPFLAVLNPLQASRAFVIDLMALA